MMRTFGLLALLTLVISAPLQALEQQGSGPPASEDSDSIARGKQIYRSGLLPSGRPVTAIVQGDVPFEGTQFNCENCHQRSGMGTAEGALVSPMITQEALYKPKTAGLRKRPAYTDESLALSLREGVDPTGDALDPIMPRYPLSDGEVADLITYIKTLSAKTSPGVTAESIRFATVITDGVDSGPMLDILQTFFEEKNNQLRNPRGRARSGPFYRTNINASYRAWELETWKLTGPPGTWREQLDAHYRERPVFALVSGMIEGSWQPIHEFCETNEVPCLLPNTDVPVIDDGYYTLYFSQGLALEAKVIAQHVARQSLTGPVVQVFRGGTTGEVAAGVLRDQLKARNIESVDVRVDGDLPIPKSRTHKRVKKSKAEAVVLWLGTEDLEAIATWPESGKPGRSRTYLSSTLNGGDPDSIVAGLRDEAYVAHPFSLNDVFENRFRRAEIWLKSRGLDVRDELVQAQTYFACMLVGEALMHVKYDYFYRDFFLESIDHMTVLANFSASHPTLSFGPGQRFASKGCYMLPPGAGQDDAEWIVPGM